MKKQKLADRTHHEIGALVPPPTLFKRVMNAHSILKNSTHNYTPPRTVSDSRQPPSQRSHAAQPHEP